MIELRSLRTRAEFAEVFAHGTRWRADYVNVVFLIDGETSADFGPPGVVRLGIAVSRRFGNAVQRNTFRRRVRDAVRYSNLPAGGYFISPRRDSDAITFAGLKGDITRLSVEGLRCGLKKVT
ncbi:ribonuclease P protein component [Ferrimicrobium acidiphilum]|uniref:ribonuclease P protein component n=1 Tax=Ferrimicrobium acidiphilum TaxID=121039 RepID=UPI0023F09313|nr:ribonuclease P protein component [Ferrimicrobium acidiphilum]